MKKQKIFWQQLIKNCLQAHLTDYAVTVAYYLLMSFFPLLLVLANFLPLIKITPQVLLAYLKVLMPADSYQLVEPASKHLLVPHSLGVLFLSLIGVLWLASRGINAMRKAFTRIDPTNSTTTRIRTKILNRMISTALVGLLVAALLFTTIGFTLLQLTVQALAKTGPNRFIQQLLFLLSYRWLFTLIAFFVTFSLIYYFVPIKKLTFKQTLPGTVIVTGSWFLFIRLFETYSQDFIKAGSYQVIGSFILLMIWLVLSCALIIFGGILNLTLVECTSTAKKVH